LLPGIEKIEICLVTLINLLFSGIEKWSWNRFETKIRNIKEYFFLFPETISRNKSFISFLSFLSFLFFFLAACSIVGQPSVVDHHLLPIAIGCNKRIPILFQL